MSQKIIEINGIGDVTFVKRRTARAIKISLTADNKVRVSLPSWVPYQSAVAFVNTRKAWIADHKRPSQSYKNGDLIGKFHRLVIIESETAVRIKTRVTATELRVTHSNQLRVDSSEVQMAIKRAGLRALKQEAEQLLPARLVGLANLHQFTYKSVDFKQLKARWGSCSHQNHITLNIFLMLLPWNLIDYVLVHELVHTKVHNHGAVFWTDFERCMPNARQLRREIRKHNPYF